MDFKTKTGRWVVSFALIAIVSAAFISASSFGVSGVVAEGVEATYKAKCASCHGLDGSGATAVGKSLKVRDLRSAEVQKQSDAQLTSIISKGKGKMPGFDKSLGAESCKALTGYIRELAKKK